MKDLDVCKNVLLKKIRCFPFGFHRHERRSSRIHEQKARWDMLGRVVGPASIIKTLWNFVLLWFIYFWRPRQKHESFSQTWYIPTCWKSTSKIWKLKHPQLQYSIHHYPPEAKHPPIIRVFFQWCQRLYMRKPGGKESTPRGNRGNPPLPTRPGWDRRKASKIQTKTIVYI